MTLKELASKVGFAVLATSALLPGDEQDEWQQNANAYRLELIYQHRRYQFDYWQGVGIKTDPTAEGCLESLQLDSQAGGQTFEDFCADTGANRDSRHEERIWKACKKVRREIQKLFGKDFEAFMSAEV